MKNICPVVLCAVVAAGCAMKKPEFLVYSLAAGASGGCSVEYPSAWTVMENESYFNPGALFVDPGPKDGKRRVHRTIALDFYPKGDKMYSSIENYITGHFRSEPGYGSEPVKPATVAGVEAKDLVYRKPLPKSAEFAPKGTLVTRVLIFPGSGGFYALADAAPEGSPNDEGGAFDRLVKSFKLTK